MASPATPFANLKTILLKLKATGDDGFEGLMAAVLTEILGVAFDLAKSGSQGGKDGQSSYDGGVVRFECKLYTGTISKNEVLTKIAEIGTDDDAAIELFILGATDTLRSQDREVFDRAGDRFGIATLFADWPATGVPNLAVLLALAPDVSTKFIALHTGTSEHDVRGEIEQVRAHAQFPDRARELNDILRAPSIAPAFAKLRNTAYLREAFENTRKARVAFAQPLAPGDKGVKGILPREGLRQAVAASLFGPPRDATVFILGGDGNGKSWIFAQTWLGAAAPPLTVIITPDDFVAPISPALLENLVIDKLLAQSGDLDSPQRGARWRRYFQKWKSAASPAEPRLVIFLDGINQREAVDWPRIINGLSALLAEIGGRLVVSCRTAFFNSRIRQKLQDPIEPIEVGQWTNPELRELLSPYQTSVETLSDDVANFLRNPRIFAIAAELFNKGTIKGFGELSVSRLLLEHLRTGTGSEPVSEAEFIAGLRTCAETIVSRVRKQEREDLKVFARPVHGSEADRSIADQLAVISDGHFFEPVAGDATLVRLKDDSSPLALGLSVLSTAQKAERNGMGIDGALSVILDPISALDDTANVLLSALIAAVLLDDNSEAVVAALAVGFVNLQNLDQSRFPEFQALVRRLPRPFLAALEEATLSDGNVANMSWLTDTIFDLRKDPSCSPAIGTQCQRWLSMYSLTPQRRLLTHEPAGSEEYNKALAEKQERLNTVLAELGPSEQALLEDLVQEPRGDYSKLCKTAFQFLAGGPLSAFGEAFRNWCFATSLNGGFSDGHELFEDLVQFNLIDWVDTQRAVLEAAKPLSNADVSNTGRWALV